MVKNSSKAEAVFGLLSFGLLNLVFDFCFLNSGWVAFDILVYFLAAVAVVFGRIPPAKPEPPHEDVPPALHRKKAIRRKLPAIKGYTGPFWNKPSTAYLEARARTSTTASSKLAPFLLLVPFAVLFYLLLRY